MQKASPQMFGIKQNVDIELFDGDPIYSLPNGKDITHAEVLGLDKKQRRFLALSFPKYKLENVEDLDAEYSEIDIDLVLKVKNRIEFQRQHNLVTNLGRNLVVDYLATNNSVGGAPLGMELGTGSTAATATNTSIETFLSGDASSFQVFISPYPVDNGFDLDWRSFFAAGNATDSALLEVVLISAKTAGTARSRIVFAAPINKGAPDTLQITTNWAITAS